MRKGLGRDDRLLTVICVLLVVWLTFLGVRAAARAEWGWALALLVSAAVIIALPVLGPRLRSLTPAPSVQRWLGRAERGLNIALVLGAIWWTIGALAAAARAEWGLALQCLATAVFSLVCSVVPRTREKGRARRSVSTTTTANDRSGARVVVLRFGRSRLKVARAIHRLRADAHLPIALIDYHALPFVAGEGLPEDVATHWVDELSAVGAIAATSSVTPTIYHQIPKSTDPSAPPRESNGEAP